MINRLPVQHREVIVLIGMLGMRYEEVAEVCGCAMGTVKSRINRGRTKLQGILKEVYTPEEA